MPGLLRAVLAAARCLALAAAAWPVFATAQVAVAPMELVFEDQFRNRHETVRLRGDVVVLVYAERHGAEAAVDLGRRLHVRFHPSAAAAPPERWATEPVVAPVGWPAGARPPDVHVVPVACLPEVPTALRAVARSRLRKESPQLSVWLDFEDDLRRSFGLVEGVPNTVVVDTAGVPRGVVPGALDERRFEELVAFIDGLRAAARPEPRLATLPAGAVVPTSGVR